MLGSDVLGVRASGLDFAGPPGTAVVTPLDKGLIDQIARLNGVDAAFGRYLESGTMEFNDRQGIGFAMSIPDGSNRKSMENIVSLKVESGRLLKDGDARKAVLGSNFKDDSLFGKGIKTGDSILLNDLKFDVVGILEKKGSFIFDSGVFLNEDVLLSDLRKEEKGVNIIAVKVTDIKIVEQVKLDIEKLLRKERNVKKGKEDFVVESPEKAIESLNSTLFAVQLFIYIIASISLIVGGIGITNTMYTSVIERTKEIGIMKAIGAKNSTIFTLFFIESGLLGMIGGAIGVGLGLIFSYGSAFAGKAALGSDLIQAKVSLVLILGALIFSFVVGTAAGLFPALRASNLHPVDSIRYAK